MKRLFLDPHSRTMESSLEFYSMISGSGRLCFDTGTNACDINWYSRVEQDNDLDRIDWKIHLEPSCRAPGIHTEDSIRFLPVRTSNYVSPQALTQREVDTRFDFHTNTTSF